MLSQRLFVFIPDPNDVETLRRLSVGKLKGDYIEAVSVEILAVSNHYGHEVAGKSEGQTVKAAV